MKKSILIIAITAVALIFAFSGCSFISGLLGGSNNGASLSAPSGLRLDDKTLTWSAVKNADRYEVSYTLNGKTSTETVKNPSFTFDEKAYGELTVKVLAKNSSSSSSYSEEISGKLYAKLSVDLTNATVTVDDGAATFSFPAVENASSYNVNVKEAAGEWTLKNSATPSIVISPYRKNYSYYFQVTAVGEGYFKNSNQAEYVIDAVPDFTDAETVEADLKNDDKASFAAVGVERVKIGSDYIPAEYLSFGENVVELSADYLENLDLGVYEVSLFDESSVYCYYLDLDDTRAPEIYFETYVKHGEGVKGRVVSYHNTFTNISKSGATLSSAYYRVEEDGLYFNGTYLDTLLEGLHHFSYNFTRGDYQGSTLFNVTVSTAIAEIKTARYVYTGDDVEVNVLTHGDSISNVKTEAGYLTKGTDYSTEKNSLVIFASYLAAHGETSFTVYSVKGLSQEIIITQQLSGFVPAKSVYDYDKNNGADLKIDGVLHNDVFLIYGAMITTADYYAKSGNVTLRSSFLDELTADEYRFMVECEGYYSYFTVKVFDSDASPKNVKFNFDIDSDVYVTFQCDCGENSHVYKLNDNSYQLCESPQLLTSFLRTVDHTLVVKCSTTGNQTTYEYDGVSAEGLTYMNSRITASGESQDLYVDSIEELAFVIKYASTADGVLTYEEKFPYGKSSVTCYYSNAFKTYAASDNTYLRQALSLSGASGVSVELSGLGNEYTVSLGFTSKPQPDSKSGTLREELLDTRAFLTSGTRAGDFDGFPINSSEIEEKITLESELDDLPLGVKPVFEGDSQAKSVYEAALGVCRSYVNDGMSVEEKLMTIYHYLTTVVTYDNNALTLYEVSANASATDNLAGFKSYLSGIIEQNPSLSSVLDPLKDYSSMEDIRKYLQGKLNSLRAFSLSGALLDHIAVCDGISSAFKLLCLIEGIECIKVSGLGITQTGTEAHAWNKVNIDGEWYIVDATWGRVSGYVNHSYFLIPEKDAVSSHVENVKRYGDVAVIDTIAEGDYDFYASEYMSTTILGKTYDMRAESEKEFLSTFSALKASDNNILEFKLNFDYGDDLPTLIGKTNTACSYYKLNGGVLIILNK